MECKSPTAEKRLDERVLDSPLYHVQLPVTVHVQERHHVFCCGSKTRLVKVTAAACSNEQVTL